MIRIVFYLVLVAGAAWGLAWVADRPGSLSIEWLGYDIRTSVFVAAIVLILFFVAVAVAIWLGVLTWTAPGRIGRHFRRRRERIGQDAIRRGIFAAGAGDKVAALRAWAIAKKNVPREPLALLLEAQSAQLNEDSIASRQAFERMLEKPEMIELGLRGLFVEAKKAGEIVAAKQFAERALTANPSLGWPSSALFEIQCREHDWRGALRTLAIAKQHKHVTRGEADKRRAVLLTQLAVELEDTQQGKALAYAQEAIGLAPSLIPAAAVAGRILAAQGSVGRAAKILTQAWRATHHPDIALIYAHVRTGDSPRERLARVKALVTSAPASLEGDIAVAAAAIEAQDWSAARLALEPHLANNPPARVCRLMARIEAGQNRDAGRVREWLAKAARGAPDPVWVAPDGTVSAEWHALSSSGALGAYEWKTPPVTARDSADELMAEMSALDLRAIEADAAGEAEGSAELLPDDEATDTPLPSPGTKGLIAEARESPQSTSEKISAAANGQIQDQQSEEAGSSTRKETSTSDQASSETQVERLPPPVKVRPEIRKPNIFIPDRPPDDPGPRRNDGDDLSTPLSRFRRPS